MAELTKTQQEIHDGMLRRRPELESCELALLALYEALVKTYERGGKLLLCGNGGSHADALHIAGELCKSFQRKRPLPAPLRDALRVLPYGVDLANTLEAGLSAITLGSNGALKTAIENDFPIPEAAFAQEACALMKPEDTLLALSTSGAAANCIMALSVARALNATAAAMTGPGGGRMAEVAEIVVRAPGESTPQIQESHVVLYHTLCALVEARFFPAPK